MLQTHSEHEDLRGGRHRVTIYQRPIAYRKNGVLHRISNYISASGDEEFTQGVDELLQVRFVPRLGKKKPAVFIKDPQSQGRTKLIPVDCNPAGLEVNNNVALYREAWSNCDLKFTFAGHRLQKDILLRSGHPKRFSFALAEPEGFNPTGLIFNNLKVLKPFLTKGFEIISLEWIYRFIAGCHVFMVDLPDGDWTGWVLDPTLILQDPTPAGADTYIVGGSGESSIANYGVYVSIGVGEITSSSRSYVARGLMQFDLSSLPVGTTVDAATISLYCEAEQSTTDRTVGVHRAITQWYEGTKNGGQPSAGEDASTWNLRNANGSIAWAGGVGGASGSDWEASATDSVPVTGTGSLFGLNVLADVQAWHGGTSDNYGWWLLNATEMPASNSIKRFTSSDGRAAANRPKLTIEYTEGGGDIIVPRQIFSKRKASIYRR